jgi:exonuclease VII small subunit
LQEAEQKVEILLKRTETADPVPFDSAADSET